MNGPWGSSITKKSPNIFRVGFQNINGIKATDKREKQNKIVKLIADLDLDLFAIQEVNLHLKRLGTHGNWKERFRFFHGFTTCAVNVHSNSKKRRLFGGTAVFLNPSTTHCAPQHDIDPTGLGRWTTTLLRGRDNIMVRIINVYRPVRTTDDRPTTVFSQHEAYFKQQGAWRDPRKAIMEDLDALIIQSLAAGEQLIVGGDLNEDTRHGVPLYWRRKWGLVEAHTHLFPELPAVSTSNRNTQNIPIDCIWTSPGLDLVDGGMTGFGEFDVDPADHRILWVDIDLESMFGFHPPPPCKRPMHSIPLNDPRVVKKYNNYVKKHRVQHDLASRLYQLEHKAVQGAFTDMDVMEYDTLCNLDNKIRETAKKKCRRFFSGQTPFSDIIDKDRRTVHLWSLVVQRRTNFRTDTRKIRRLMAQTGIMDALQKTLEQSEAAKALALKQLRRDKKNAASLQENFVKRVSQRWAEKYGTTVEHEEQLLSNTKKQRFAFRTIKRVLGKDMKQAILSVTENPHNDPGSTAIHHYSKEAIEQACSREGQRRFSQVADNPCLQGSLLRDLGYLAAQDTVDAIMGGTYMCEADVDEYTRKFIQQLRKPQCITEQRPITGTISTLEHIRGWTRMKSTIASSPFGPVFLDYIAATNDIKVADVDAAFASIPTIMGFCPLAWSKAVDVMIPKKAVSAHVTKLRIIVLFHALFNMINKNVGRQMIQQAERLGQIPSEAYGSRPGKQANVCALNKVLTYDVIRQKKLLSALCSNDAIACYDRIVHAIASICMQRLGVDKNTCRLMFGTLQQVEHFISTAYGLSDTPYGAVEFPLQGVGQGNRAGPAIWLVITIPLINMLRDAGFGFRSRSAISKEDYRFVCYTYVDDTDVVHVSPSALATAQQLVSEMQSVIDHWEGGLRATGGALSADKSYWYLIDFQWSMSQQRWNYKSVNSTPGTLNIIGGGNADTRQELQRHETDHANETLGLWIAPDGNQTAQLRNMHDKVCKWADKIRTGQLSRTNAWLSLRMGISKSLDYPLVATRLSKTQCKSILKPLLDVALPALGLPRNLSHNWVFSPTEFLGLGFPDIWPEQAFQQIQTCLQFGSATASDITGCLLRDIRDSLRVELGLPGSPFTHDFYKFQRCTTPTQLHTLWEFCTDTGFELHDGMDDIPVRREGDRFLMDVLQGLPFTPGELAAINRCRLHLNVLLLSDITTGDGRRLDPTILGRRRPIEHPVPITWPRAGTPNLASWRLWDKAISLLARDDAANGQLLFAPLGRWLAAPTDWPWLYCTIGNRIYHRTAGGSETYACASTGHRTRQPRFHKISEDSEIPTTALPTTVQPLRSLLRHTGTVSILPPAQTLDDDTWSAVVIESPENLYELLEGIRNGTAVCVTDGSFKTAMGTAAFTVLAHILSTDGYLCVNMTPGEPAIIDAYRAELGGIYGCLTLLNRLAARFALQGSITLGCDCASALQNLLKEWDPKPNRPHWDLLSAIRAQIKASPLVWHFKHVKGHQDRTVQYRDLDRWGQLNVEMDSLAKSYWQTLDRHRPPPFSLKPMPGQWSIWYQRLRFASWTRDLSTKVFYNPAVMAYWNKRGVQDLSAESIGRHPPWPYA